MMVARSFLVEIDRGMRAPERYPGGFRLPYLQRMDGSVRLYGVKRTKPAVKQFLIAEQPQLWSAQDIPDEGTA